MSKMKHPNTTGTPEEYKTFNSYLVKTDQQQGIVESIVAVMGNVDQGDDVIRSGAFTKTISDRFGQIKVLDQHNTDSILRVLGRPVSMRELSREELPADLLAKYPSATGGLYTKTQYNLQTDNGRNAFNLIAAGDVSEYSIGYDPVDTNISHEMVDGKQRTVRELRQLRLYEYSPVIWGMNSATQTLSAKGASGAADLPLADRARAWDASGAEGRVRTWAAATDAPNAKYRSAFFWYDSGAADNFTSYKLQFADVIDGTLTAIPRGIFAVAAVLQGSRGGVDIPAGDKEAIKGKVSSYYAKMRAKFDDESIVAPWDSKSLKDSKPWNVFHEGDKWNVYKVDADGNATGDALGSHDNEADARAQVRALYAAEGKAIKASQSFNDALMQTINESNLYDLRWKLESALSESLTSIAEDAALDMAGKTEAMRQSLMQYSDALINWFGRAIESGMYEQESEQDMMYRMYAQHTPETKAGRVLAQRNADRIMSAMQSLMAALTDAGIDMGGDSSSTDNTDNAPAKRAANHDESAQAGPSTTTPTDDTLRQSLEIELESLKLLEV